MNPDLIKLLKIRLGDAIFCDHHPHKYIYYVLGNRVALRYNYSFSSMLLAGFSYLRFLNKKTIIVGFSPNTHDYNFSISNMLRENNSFGNRLGCTTLNLE